MAIATPSHYISEIHTLTKPFPGDKELDEIISILLYALGDIGTKGIIQYTLSQGGNFKEKLNIYLNDRVLSIRGYIPKTIYSFISNPELGYHKDQEKYIISHRDFYASIQGHKNLKSSFLKLIIKSIHKDPNNIIAAEIIDPNTGSKISINKEDMKYYIEEILSNTILIDQLSEIAESDLYQSAHILSTIIRSYGFENFDTLSIKIDFSLFTAEFIFLVIDELFQFLIPSRHSIIRSLWTKSDIEAKLLNILDDCESKNNYTMFFQLIAQHESIIKTTTLKKIIRRINELIPQGSKNDKKKLEEFHTSFLEGNKKFQRQYYNTNTERFEYLSPRKTRALQQR